MTPTPTPVSAVLDRLQAVEPRSDAVLRPLVEGALVERALVPGALAGADATGREERRRLVASLTAAVGAGPEAGSALQTSGAEESGAMVVAALVEAMPTTVAWLVDRGVPEADAWRSMADVPRKIAAYGVAGTGADWLAAVATGSVVTVGRLQFERPGQAPGRPDGEQAWGVHIPELGPLDPSRCDEAFAAAPTVLERLWGVRAGWWSCDSWVLDPRLPAILGAESNLVRFAARFAVQPEPDRGASTGAAGERPATGDASIAKFVFGSSVDAMRTAVPNGRLQVGLRAVLDGGDHWTERVGVAEVRR
ncbi:acyltransferase domain-containing protein [Curtobacterium sp. RRHDQ10]|uniref:acyltransferase domain-containing protein n=1 Tax=Curtobacterium phyllosphaerae TaxID=3413379 RepID=UPI003BF2A1BA